MASIILGLFAVFYFKLPSYAYALAVLAPLVWYSWDELPRLDAKLAPEETVIEDLCKLPRIKAMRLTKENFLTLEELETIHYQECYAFEFKHAGAFKTIIAWAQLQCPHPSRLLTITNRRLSIEELGKYLSLKQDPWEKLASQAEAFGIKRSALAAAAANKEE